MFLYGALGYIESFLLIYVGSRIMGHQPDVRRLIPASAVHIGLVIGFRQLYAIWAIPMGSHTIFSLFLLILLIRWVAQSRLIAAAVGGILGVTFVLLGGVLVALAVALLGLEAVESPTTTETTLAFLMVLEKLPLLFVSGLIKARSFVLVRIP